MQSRRVGLTVVVLACLLAATGCSGDGSGAGRASSAASPTFDDEFSGTALDTAKWIPMDSEIYGAFAGRVCDKPRDVVVRGGLLRLLVRKESAPFTCKAAKAFRTQFTGGSISTRGRFAQTYGRFEVRARYPAARQSGLHGAYWLYPERLTYGKWPSSGEIDVAEWWSKKPATVLPSLHYPGQNFWADSGWRCGVGDVAQWHTYTLDWSRQRMAFLIDGRQCWQRVWNPQAPLTFPQPFDQPFNIVLSMGVDGPEQISAGSTFPQEFDVDYVRAWK